MRARMHHMRRTLHGKPIISTAAVIKRRAVTEPKVIRPPWSGKMLDKRGGFEEARCATPRNISHVVHSHVWWTMKPSTLKDPRIDNWKFPSILTSCTERVTCDKLPHAGKELGQSTIEQGHTDHDIWNGNVSRLYVVKGEDERCRCKTKQSTAANEFSVQHQ